MANKVDSAPQTIHFLAGNFDVEIDCPHVKPKSFFTAAAGLSASISVIEKTMATKDGKVYTAKYAGVAEYSEVTLKRNLTTDKGFWLWLKDIRDGKKDFRHSGSIVLYGSDGTETGRWTFDNAWPSKLSASDLDASSDDLITEEITLQIEMLKRTK